MKIVLCGLRFFFLFFFCFGFQFLFVTFQIFPSPVCVVCTDFSTWEIFLFDCASFGGVCKNMNSLKITDDLRRADDGGLKYSPDPFVLCCSKE